MNFFLPLVSIVVPCYNHAAYIQECIKSIIDQDYDAIELIIIDDGSSDDSVSKIQEMVAACEARFVRFEFRSRPNVGLCNTLNEAVKWCAGEFYSAIASDDLMLPKKTSSQVNYLLSDDACIAVFSGVQIIGSDGRRVRVISGTDKNYKFKDIFLGRCSLPAPTLMLRLEKLKSEGGYPSDLHIEDWYMWLKLTESGGYVHSMGGVVAEYRRHDTNISNQSQKMQLARIQIVNAFSFNPLYRRAMANALIQSAIDAQLVSRKQSFIVLVSAFGWSFKDLFQKKCFKYVLKFLIPRKLLSLYFSNGIR